MGFVLPKLNNRFPLGSKNKFNIFLRKDYQNPLNIYELMSRAARLFTEDKEKLMNTNNLFLIDILSYRDSIQLDNETPVSS